MFFPAGGGTQKYKKPLSEEKIKSIFGDRLRIRCLGYAANGPGDLFIPVRFLGVNFGFARRRIFSIVLATSKTM